jgi:hypothetical protein
MEQAGGHNPDEIRDGRYANHFSVGHNAYEVILQFGQFYEGNEKPVMHTTIVTSPVYAQLLLSLLRQTMAQYEGSFGSVGKEDPS